jgi:[acyl-carrier-protein] S-malonyltransferase
MTQALALEPKTGPAAAGSIVFMFPGQSSRYPDMMEALVATDPASAAIVATASDILGRDLAAHYSAANRQIFARNRDIQVGVFLANHLRLCMVEGAGIRAAWSLGLSLGEYNHLVHIGALNFEQALRLVDERGRLYDDGPAGVMVSVFPVGGAQLELAIARLGLTRDVAVGLYNSPRQQVLSGERRAVEQVVAALDSELLIEVVEIESRIPMHAPLFAPVAARFRTVLERTPLSPPRLPYVPNVRGTVVENATTDEIRDCLAAHVCEAVRWQASVETVAARVSSPCFLEVGPRSVLYGLFGRGWMPGRRARTDLSEGRQDHLTKLLAELCDGA